ncbi:MAG: IS3 family transposase, partial [Thermoanaerobaculia bacterium]
MPRTHKPYPDEFKKKLVALVRAGRTPEELAREFEPSAQAIRNWVAQAERDEGTRDEGLTTSERDELRRLRRENERLREEREILKKAGGLVRSGDQGSTERIFEFVRAHQAEFRVTTMCRVLGVSTSGYYAWRSREKSERARRDEALTQKIVQAHHASRGTYGAPRILVDPQEQGERVGRKRVARLMRNANVVGVCRRRWIHTTRRDPKARPAPDLVDREFAADGPNQLWVADMTYIPTVVGFLYLAVVLDVWSRRIVGWAFSARLATQVVLDALDMAIERRGPVEDVIHHSDQGCQYTSLAFGARCRQAGVRPSMGSVGDCYDNAMCESFFATLECELLDRTRFADRAAAELAVFDFIEGFYNTRRRHSGIGNLAPVVFERRQLASSETEASEGSHPL